MANKKTYTIEILGIKESYADVKSLQEVLSSLDDKVIKVQQTEEKAEATRKQTKSSTDALTKAQEKLANYDKAYQEELAKVNAELSANKKEISDALKVQQAQQVVDAKQLDTYKDKQTYLTALNTLIRNHSTVTDEDKDAISRMVQESAQLQAELKATDEQMKIYVRNVGNYPGAAEMVVESHKSLKQELKEIKSEMAEMLANGVSKTDEGYLKLAERAGQLKDAMGDASKDIANFASDTRGLSNAINLATSAVNAYQLYNSALQVFGFENENAAESMQKMMAIMTLLNSLQQVQNSLLENGSATARLYSKSVELIKDMLGLKKAAVEADTASTEANSVANETNSATAEANAVANETASAASETNTAVTGANTAAQGTNTAAVGTNTGAVGTNTAALGANTTANQTATTATNSLSVAQKAGAVASKTLSVALRAIPLMFIIGLVISLIQNWESIWNWFKKTFPVLDTLSQKFNKFGGFMNAIVTGAKAVAAAVVNWLINPFKTFANVVGKILSGDFEGAWKAALDGVKNQFKGTVDAFKGEVVKGYARGQEEMSAKAAAESNKRTQQELKELKIQERNNKTYSKKYIDLQKKDFEERRKMAKGNQEELNKIKLEEMQFDADVEDKKTAYAKSQAAERSKTAKSALAAAKKEADEYEKRINKLIEDSKKLIEDSDKMVAESTKSIEKNEADAKKMLQNQSVYFKNELEKRNFYLEAQIKKQQQLLETAKKEYNAWVSGAELTGTTDEDTQYQIKRWANSISEAETMLSIYNAQLDTNKEKIKEYLATIAESNARRKELMVQNLAEEGIALQKTYQDALDNVAKQMAKIEDELERMPKKDKERIGQLNKDLEDLKKRHDALLKSMQEQLGEYANKEIKIPVDIDTKGIIERYNKLSAEMEEKGIPLKFNELEVTDMILGFGNTFEQVFNNVARNGILYEITKQFSYWGQQAELTADQVKDAERIINGGLSVKDTEELLLQLADKFKVTKEEMQEVFDYIERNASKANPMVETFRQIGQVAGLSEEKLAELEETLKNGLNFEETNKAVMELLSHGEVNLKKFGELAYNTTKQIKDANDELNEQIKKSWTDIISASDKNINDVMLGIKRFQDATKELKFEPVMENDAFTKYFGGQILNIEKTKERYGELKIAYGNYLNSIREGGSQMQIIEQSWQQKLDATAKLYGIDSYEYRKAVEDKKQALNVFKTEREKVSQQIEQIEKKEGEVTRDYYESLEKQMKSVYSQLAENVFEPLADGFGALLDFQLEKAQEALEEIEELYDKAVEAREESAARMQEINNELRADDGQNKEELQQRLAEEEVLLVQREETERALEKEKKKREYEVNVAEAKQRKFELGQKLIEGLVNTALGVTAALKYGPILGPIFAAIIGAMGALQTGIIAKQIGQVKMPQKFAKGGRIGEQGFSRSHSQGGHRIEGTNIEVEGQEWVVNKKSSKKYNTLLNAINDDNAVEIKRQVEMLKPSTVNNYVTNNYQNQRQFAGKQIVKYATGGQINYSEAARTVEANRDASQLAQLIKQINFQPQVAVTDINRVNKNLTKVRDLARG